MDGLIVTTTAKPRPEQEARAQRVADRCDAPYVRRHGSVARMRRRTGARLVYQVGRVQEELRDDNGVVTVHEGLTVTRVGDREHPLIRALGAVDRVVDCTLGLAQDALHIAGATGASVIGAEASPVVFSLVEEGLRRMGERTDMVGEAARRIRPELGRAEQVLSEMESGSVDAVFVAPMFRAPRPAQPGFAVFRSVAVHDPLPGLLVEEALRVGQRLVVKVVRGDAVPDVLAGAERFRGRSLDYLVLESARC